MRNIKIDEPVFRDKPLTDQDLKEREYMYLMGKDAYEKSRGIKSSGRIKKHKKYIFLRIVLLCLLFVFVFYVCACVGCYMDNGTLYVPDFLKSGVFQDFFSKFHFLS